MAGNGQSESLSGLSFVESNRDGEVARLWSVQPHGTPQDCYDTAWMCADELERYLYRNLDVAGAGFAASVMHDIWRYSDCPGDHLNGFSDRLFGVN